MPNLLASTWGRRAAFFFLYVTEGIPLGFTAVAIAAQMRQRGLGPGAIGAFVASLYLPWAWKWAAGPVVDLVYSNRLGRRRAWIVGTQLLMATTLLLAWPIDFVTRLQLFTAIILVLNIFSAVQDVAIDALAVDSVPKEERGVVNGLMFAGSYLGSAIGGSGVLFLSAWIGFNATFPFVVGALLAVTFGISFWLRERPVRRLAYPGSRAADDEMPAGTDRAYPLEHAQGSRLGQVLFEITSYAMSALKAVFGSRNAVAGLVFALLPTGAFSLSLLGPTISVELGMSESGIATLVLVNSILSAAGCVLGGWLSDRVGRRASIAVYVLLTLIPTLALAWGMWRAGWIMPVDTTAENRVVASQGLLSFYWIAAGAFSFVFGLIYGSRSAIFMDLCDPAVAATQFTAYMALMNLTISYSATWQGWSAEKWGYPVTLALDAAIGLLCLCVLPLMYPRPTPQPIEAEPVTDLAHSESAIPAP